MSLKLLKRIIIVVISLLYFGCSENSEKVPVNNNEVNDFNVSITVNVKYIEIYKNDSHTISWTSQNANACHIDNGIGDVSLDGSYTVSPSITTTYTLTVFGDEANANTKVRVRVLGNTAPQPEGSFGQKYNDLIPPDATIESYDKKRFSIITGRIINSEENGIPDVEVSLKNHKEYGTVYSNETGMYSIPVEGGKKFVLEYTMDGYITSHRDQFIPWNEVMKSPPIKLISEDAKSSSFILNSNSADIFSHQSTMNTDDFGERASTTVISGDNAVYALDENNLPIHQLDSFTIRSTEFRLIESMPSKLPPASQFTYCVDLKIDGIERVQFDNPVVLWINNFLNFEVGTVVPIGYYDREKALWVPSKNGIVVMLLDTDSDGIVDAVDSNGDSLPDDLDSDGSVFDETIGLENSDIYVPLATYWRAEVTHFTPWDCNWPGSFPSDADRPNPSLAPNINGQLEQDNDCKKTINSYVEERSRILQDRFKIPGTELYLHYSSNKVDGFTQYVTVPVSGSSVPASLKRIIVQFQIAGQKFEQTFSPLPDQKAEFIWDGRDYLGNPIHSTIGEVAIGFVYDAVYYAPGEFEKSFAQVGMDATANISRQEVISWRRNSVNFDRSSGTLANGWTLSTHHQIDPAFKTILHRGDGTILKKDDLKLIDLFISGIGIVYGLALDSKGNLYISGPAQIFKSDPEGNTSIIAGTGVAGYSGDGGLATAAQLNSPRHLEVDSTGNIYFADYGNNRIRKIDTYGIITTVAGNGTAGYSGDNGPAVDAQLNRPNSVAVDNLGSLYIADKENNLIRKVDPEGTITRFAGTIYSTGTTLSGNGDSALEARLFWPEDVEVDLNGTVYIVDGNPCVRKVESDGTISAVTFCTIGAGNYSGDNGPAINAQLRDPSDIEIDKVGNLYIADNSNNRIRMIDTAGIIRTITGNGASAACCTYSGDGGTAREAWGLRPSSVVIDPGGTLYLTDTYTYRIRKIYSEFESNKINAGSNEFAVPDVNGKGHIFSTAGKHLKTIDLNTGVIVQEFSYNADGNVISINDQFANIITIEWAAGKPTAIIPPNGVRTDLVVDADNNLTQIVYPDTTVFTFNYGSGGLLTKNIDPKGNNFDYVYNSYGRLTDVLDQAGGHWIYSRTEESDGSVNISRETGENVITNFYDDTYYSGAFSSSIVSPTGFQTSYSKSSDGLVIDKDFPSGVNNKYSYSADPYYKTKYISEFREVMPSMIEKTITFSRDYTDTNFDSVPDIISNTTSVNARNFNTVFDKLESSVTHITPEGRNKTVYFNPLNLSIEEESVAGLNSTNYSYDSKGRLISNISGDRIISYSYDDAGNLESLTDSNSKTKLFSYDLMGRLITITRPDTSIVGLSYDLDGNLTGLNTPSSVDHQFSFNEVNNKASYQPPLHAEYIFTYDKDRRLTGTTFPSGKQITNVYNNALLESIQTPDGNITFTYINGSQLESVSNASESVSLSYDGRLITSKTFSGILNSMLSYAYNNDLQVSDFTYAGSTDNYTYDNDGLLSGTSTYTISRNAGNGLPETVLGGALSFARLFNNFGEINGESSIVNSIIIYSYSLVRDNVGRITSKTEAVDGTAHTYNYTYDDSGRLLTVERVSDSTVVEEYEYGPNGTRTYEMNILRGIASRNISYTDEDQLIFGNIASEDPAYSYDADGFLISKASGADVTLYEYSTRGELVTVTLSASDGRTIEYVYSPIQQRIAKKIDGAIVEKYLWDGLTRLLAVYDGSDNCTIRFEYADAKMPFSMTSGGITYYLSYDQIGTLKVVSDSLGNVVKKIDYDSYGNIISDSNPAFSVPFGFAGGLMDRDTNLVHFGYRDYDPDKGRWTSKDPIGFAGGDTDLYGYCLNNPVSVVDPSGLLVPAIMYAAYTVSFYTMYALMYISTNPYALEFVSSVYGHLLWKAAGQEGTVPNLSPQYNWGTFLISIFTPRGMDFIADGGLEKLVPQNNYDFQEPDEYLIDDTLNLNDLFKFWDGDLLHIDACE